MEKLRNVKGFVVGLIVGVLLVGTTVLASGAIASATFNTNRVIFDGVELDLDMPLVSIVTEENPGFFSNYMPVRAVLEAMGYSVDWDGANNAVLVSSEATEQPPATTQAQPASTLVGTWYWMGTPYYVLQANNQGTMAGSNIRWTAVNRVLSICVTPDLCGTNCIAPTEWDYTLDGNRLTLTSRTIAGMSFEYTRR
ncbi:MAG: copper amine oxidase N-terminal domain-containing protein [Defluviitaleaceae bacterium]|nr:copper amine oxidase N-terminal domain-containing protein [Defluviitaleaceae bacterium]